MAQLTYKIFHIRVGAERPLQEEYYGYVNNDTGYIFLQQKITDLVDFSIRYGKLNGEWVYNTHYKMWIDKRGLIEMTGRCFEEKNPNHPLSFIAEKLGATIYGGFEDEKDFYIVLPTLGGKKSGDVLYSKDDCYRKLVYWNPNVGTLCINREGHCDEDDTLAYFLRNRELDDSDTLEGNIIEEYARTGIIENDLYKHFF